MLKMMKKPMADEHDRTITGTANTATPETPCADAICPPGNLGTRRRAEIDLEQMDDDPRPDRTDRVGGVGDRRGLWICTVAESGWAVRLRSSTLGTPRREEQRREDR